MIPAVNKPAKNNQPANVIFIGSSSAFSLAALQTLIEHKQTPIQIILAGHAPANSPPSSLPVSAPARPLQIDTLAQQQGIPVHYVATAATLREMSLEQWPQPDYLLVACFPYLLPSTFIRWPTQRCLNLHPSLLPAYRGPDPVFWQLHNGEQHTGISLHIVTDLLDAGPVVSQIAIDFPAGASRKRLDIFLAQQGVELFCRWLSHHKACPPPMEQIERNATYYPNPAVADYVVSTNWSAKHAFQFMRGAHTPAAGYPIIVSGKNYFLQEALEFDTEQRLSSAIKHEHDNLLIQFSPGTLRAVGKETV